MIFRLVIAACLLIFSVKCLAQDLIFSQFHGVPGQINPALVGLAEAPRFTVGYRNRAPAFPNAYVSSVLYYDQYIDRYNSSIGVGMSHDRHGEGVWQVNNITAFYAYNAAITRSTGFRIGIEGGLLQYNLDYDRLIFFDQLHPESGVIWPDGSQVETAETTPASNSITRGDLSAGFAFYTSSFYVGFSAKHILSPEINFLRKNDIFDYGLDIRYSAHAGWDIPLKKSYRGETKAFISPYALWVDQGGAGQINAGMLGGANILYAGLWYRYAEANPDAVIAMVGFRKGVVKIGYSYDYIISDLSNELTSGAHEILFTLNFADSEAFKKRKYESRYLDCFRLFR